LRVLHEEYRAGGIDGESAPCLEGALARFARVIQAKQRRDSIDQYLRGGRAVEVVSRFFWRWR